MHFLPQMVSPGTLFDVFNDTCGVLEPPHFPSSVPCVSSREIYVVDPESYERGKCSPPTRLSRVNAGNYAREERDLYSYYLVLAVTL